MIFNLHNYYQLTLIKICQAINLQTWVYYERYFIICEAIVLLKSQALLVNILDLISGYLYIKTQFQVRYAAVFQAYQNLSFTFSMVFSFLVIWDSNGCQLTSGLYFCLKSLHSVTLNNNFWVLAPLRSLDRSNTELKPLLQLIIRDEFIGHCTFTYNIVLFWFSSGLL